MPEQTDIYISSFPDAESITDADKVTGLQGNANKNFTFSSIKAWFVNAVKSAFVPVSRTINGKSLSSDVTLTATDVGARPNTWTPSAADVGLGNVANERQYSALNPPPLPTPSDIGAQDEITASGILKGDGAGGVSAATPGQDYQAPLTIDSTPTASSTNPVQSGGVYSATAGYGLGVMLNTQTAIADCDSVSVTGWFNTDNNTLHCPTGANKNSVLYCVARGAQYAYQEFYDPFKAKLYRRWKNQTSPWEAWYLSDNGSPAFEQQLAYVETGTTASRAYAVGEYFCWNGILYRVKQAISSGGTFTPGTNCEQVMEGGLNSFHCLSGELSTDITGVFMRFGSLVTVYLDTCQVAINGSSYTNMGNLPFTCYQGIKTNVYGNDREYVVDIAANSRALRIKWVGGAALPSGGKPSIRGIVQYITTE